MLLDYGADVNDLAPYESLDDGADVNDPEAYESRENPLQIAVENGNVEILQLLLDVGADVNASAADKIGRTAFK